VYALRDSKMSAANDVFISHAWAEALLGEPDAVPIKVVAQRPPTQAQQSFRFRKKIDA
jgi:hypothetical protein